LHVSRALVPKWLFLPLSRALTLSALVWV
jgi:hypothetical protein